MVLTQHTVVCLKLKDNVLLTRQETSLAATPLLACGDKLIRVIHYEGHTMRDTDQKHSLSI